MEQSNFYYADISFSLFSITCLWRIHIRKKWTIIRSNHTYPTIDGYFYYPSINYSETQKNRDFNENGIVVFYYGGFLGVQYNPVTLSQYILAIAPYASTNSDAYESIIVKTLTFYYLMPRPLQEVI